MLVVSLLFNPLAKITLTIAFGYFLKRKRFIDDKLQTGLNRLVSQAFSITMILSLSNQEFSKELSAGLTQTVIIALGFYAVSIALTRLLGGRLALDEAGKRAFYATSVLSNAVYFGLVLALELYGRTGLMYMTIYNIPYRVMLYTYGVSALGAGRKSLTQIVSQPQFVASGVFIAILVSPFKLPGFLQETLASIGACMSPLAMILIGCSLAGIDLREIFTDKYAWLVSIIRLLIAPLATAATLSVLPVDKTAASICVLAAAMPVAVSLYPFAELNDTAPQFVSRCITQSTILMIVTLPVILSISMYLI